MFPRSIVRCCISSSSGNNSMHPSTVTKVSSMLKNLSICSRPSSKGLPGAPSRASSSLVTSTRSSQLSKISLQPPETDTSCPHPHHHGPPFIEGWQGGSCDVCMTSSCNTSRNSRARRQSLIHYSSPHLLSSILKLNLQTQSNDAFQGKAFLTTFLIAMTYWRF